MKKKQVFAHLCTWFSTPEGSGKWEMWESGYKQALHDPDIIEEDGRRDIAAYGYPLTGPYDSADEAAIRYQLTLMRLTGIDGVVVDWDGRRLNPSRHEKFLRLLKILGEFGLKIIVCFEEWCGYYPVGTFATREAEIAAAVEELDWLAQNVADKDFYARIDGKKPVFVFRKVAGKLFDAGEWDRIKASPAAADMEFYFENCFDDALAPAADGWFFWVGNFDENRRNDLDFQKRAFDAYLEKTASRKSTRVIPSVLPGFDDTCVWGWGEGDRVAPRYDGKRYQQSWERAIGGEFDAVQIVTFNDWNEGSHIEPSTEFGYKYLSMTAKYISIFKDTKILATEGEYQKALQLYFDRTEGKDLLKTAKKERELLKSAPEISTD